MSPYRVLARFPNGDLVILAAMMSIDKLTNGHRIHIVAKCIPSDDETILTHKDVAHIQTTSANSQLLDIYDIRRSLDFGRMYSVSYKESATTSYTLGERQHTQQDCLVAAMKDYCTKNDIKIEEVL